MSCENDKIRPPGRGHDASTTEAARGGLMKTGHNMTDRDRGRRSFVAEKTTDGTFRQSGRRLYVTRNQSFPKMCHTVNDAKKAVERPRV